MVSMLYVVICWSGEYSDRVEYVAGVFDDKTLAIQMAEKKKMDANAAEVKWLKWCEMRSNVIAERGGLVRALGVSGINQGTQQLIDEICGPQPPSGEFEDYYIAEVEPNAWGHWEELKGTDD